MEMTYQFLPSLGLNDYETLAQSLKGKCLMGLRGHPFLLVKIQEVRKGNHAGCYDLWLFDGVNVWESKHPFLALALPALVSWVQMRGIHFKEPISWRLKEIKDADIDI